MLLESKRILLRPLQRSDLPLVHQALNDSRLSLRYLPTMWRLYSLEQLEHLLADWNNQTDCFVYIIEEIGSGIALGMLNIDSINYALGHAEIGITLFSSKYQNKGYAKESIFLALTYMFKELRLHRVFARIMQNNLPSLRLFTKLGFVEEGRMREHAFREGKFEDMLIFSMLEAEFFSKVNNLDN